MLPRDRASPTVFASAPDRDEILVLTPDWYQPIHPGAQCGRRTRRQRRERIATHARLRRRVGAFQVNRQRAVDLSLEIERGEHTIDRLADLTIPIQGKPR